eukprot:GHUV01009454.1.p1 GENE.GHUV01009454.1~~GHUV01009454.1.p1  ORF type:complete len:239 (+),score=63.69 GHUV01009454.1:162-878(+)
MQLLERSSQRIVCSTAVSGTRQLTRRTERHWGHACLHRKDTPIKLYLRSALALRDQVVDSALALVPSLRDLGPSEVTQVVQENVHLLGNIAPSQEAVRRVVLSNPGLLAAPLGSWFDFFSEYGLEARQFWQLLCSHPNLMQQGSVFAAGSAILFLKAVGWSDLEITTIIIPFHAAVLQMDVHVQLQPVLEYLVNAKGLSDKAAQQFLHQHPGVLYDSDYQAEIQQLLRRERRMQLQSL